MKKISYKELIKFDEENEITTMVKCGGYNYWDWKFPFIHYKEEELFISTRKKIYKQVEK